MITLLSLIFSSFFIREEYQQLTYLKFYPYRAHEKDILETAKKNKKPILLNEYFPEVKDEINLKDHKIKFSYKKNDFSAKGNGKIKLQDKLDEIEYSIIKKGKDFNFISNIFLSKLNIKNQPFLKNFFPNIKETIDLKDHKIKIKYNKNNIYLDGSGKIKLDKDLYILNTDVCDANLDRILQKNRLNINEDFEITFDKNKRLIPNNLTLLTHIG